jgi:dTDP-glucose 4,6-dehydratase
MTLFVTGAAGFIGSSFLRVAKNHNKFEKIVVLDSLTYAGRIENIEQIIDNKKYFFEKIDIRNFEEVNRVFIQYQPSAVVHFAAESHVDNSISGPRVFIETNIVGTLNLLEASRSIFQKPETPFQNQFKFIHVSTDEVFGQLGDTGYFNEQTAYQPSSPYSASKAGSDHLARAWHHTYKLPTIITNCSNNYGPRQFPEKLIPRIILNCLSEKPLPVYGQGLNVRDWIYVDDHAEGVWLALTQGTAGDTYCLGGNSERKNIDVVKTICQILDQKKPRKNGEKYEKLIQFVEDRKGHDFRYAIDDSYATKKLGYTRRFKTFEDGLESTINWYLENTEWVSQILKGNI